MTGIYKIKSPTGKIYIGQSTNIERRWRQHKSNSGSPRLQSSFNKHGIESHVFQVIHELPNDIDKRVLATYEQLYLDQYKDCGVELLNLCVASVSNRLGVVASESSKKKMSDAKIGKRRSQIAIEKGRLKLIGRVCSKETRQRIGAANKISQKGKKLSPESIAKREETRRLNFKPRKLTDEQRNTMSINRKGVPNFKNRGKKQTPESIKKRFEKRSGYKASESTKEKQSKALIGKPWSQKRVEAYLKKKEVNHGL